MLDFAKTKKELEMRDRAYTTATGFTLTECMNFQEIQDIEDKNLEKIAWEPFEYWEAKELHKHIAGLANAIYNQMEAILKIPNEE